MSPSRRDQVTDRLADSKFVRDVVGPRVLKPLSDWYETNLADTNGSESTPADPDLVDHTGHRAADVAGDPPAESDAAENDADSSDADPITPNSTKTPTPDTAAPAPMYDSAPGVLAVAKGVKTRVKDHNLVVVAAGIAFWGLLAIPAVLTATLSIYGLVADPERVESQIENNLGDLPDEARQIIIGQLESVASTSGGGLAVGAVVGLLLALWTSSGAVSKLIATFNTVWGVSENRSFPKLRGLALAMTFGAIVFVGAALFLLALMPAILSEVGLGAAGRWALNVGRFPALVAVMSVGLAMLYRMGPNRPTRHRLVTRGSVTATLLWVAVSGAFSIYTARFDSYNETYGTLGAAVMLLMWLFLTALMVILGAEIDAEYQAQRAETQD